RRSALVSDRGGDRKSLFCHGEKNGTESAWHTYPSLCSCGWSGSRRSSAEVGECLNIVSVENKPTGAVKNYHENHLFGYSVLHALRDRCVAPAVLDYSRRARVGYHGR